MAEYVIVDVEEVYAVAAQAECEHKDLGPTISELFSQLSQQYGDADLLDAPLLHYTEWNENTCRVEAAFPVEPSIANKVYPACTALMTTHIGPYNTLQASWLEIWNEIRETGMKPTGACWDRYLPYGDAPESQWQTEIYVAVDIPKI